MAKIPFITDNYRNNIPVNWYPAKDDEMGVVMWGTPGLELLVNIGSFPIRAMRVVGDYLYAVAGYGFYRVDTAFTSTLLGSLDSGDGGPAFIEDNGIEIIVVIPGTAGYLYTISSGAWAQIAFPSSFLPSSVAFQDGYFVVSESASGKFWISGLYDGDSWDATDYAVPEGRSDNLICLFSDHRELWLFGNLSTEVWYNSGDTFPFTRNSAGFIEVGCVARHSVTSFDNSVVWLTNLGQLVRAEGYAPKVISTRKLEREWNTYSTISDAEGFAYVYEGHWFYHLSFPKADKTWVYDGATGLWHERRSALRNGRHRAGCHAIFGHRHMIGDCETGNIYEMKSDVYDDNGDTITRVLETSAARADGLPLFFPGLQIEFQEGETILQSGQGSDPQAMLQWSDDGGKTWGNEHWRSMGKVGEYKHRATWRRLGMSRDRVFRLTMTDPAPATITSWNLIPPVVGRV